MSRILAGHRPVLCLFSILLFTACDSPAPDTYAEPRRQISSQSFDFQNDIRPIIDQRCVACHSCNDAPCQLKLEADGGLERGASKQKVYDGTRAVAVEPTRLHVDATSIDGWRNKGFYSVLAVDHQGRADTLRSLMHRMLDLGQQNPPAANQPLSDDYETGINRPHQCPLPEEFDRYAKTRSHAGMPYAVTPLSMDEYRALTTWLEEGAAITPPPVRITDAQQRQIADWEALLNADDLRSQLVARYLYEHLFLAHLYFEDSEYDTTRFFTLVRSHTDAPEAIVPVATVRPNDDPGGEFFYRLQPLTDTLVHKTHIVYALSDERMSRIQSLFHDADWSVDRLPDYGYRAASNPFTTFAALPARARYEFMLDDAEYIIRTFIRGPVCRGQVATSVIRDRFRVMFEHPDVEQFVNDPDYAGEVSDYLGLPGQETDLLEFGAEWLKYNEDRNTYWRARYRQYAQQFPDGPNLNHIWLGEAASRDALLTVYRHHNSASVTRGWQGKPTQTAWVMDFPLLERTYYELVVNFNVYGNIAHQAQTRLYFDLNRHGGESNLLRFLPAGKRQAQMDEWYQGMAEIKEAVTYHDIDMESPGAAELETADSPYQSLLEQIQDSYRDLAASGCAPGNCNNGAVTAAARVRQTLQRLEQGTAASAPGILQLPEVTVLSVLHADGKSEYFSLFRNRAHSNVAFMFGESLRYQPELDTLTVLDFPLSSYPNFIFQVPAESLQAFVDDLLAMPDQAARKALVSRWGVRRTAAGFWDVFHGISSDLQQRQPLQAGIMDLNRYLGW